MSKEIVPVDNKGLELYYNSVCQEYGVDCKLLTKNKYVFSDKKEHYFVFGINGVPEDLDVKEIFIRNERSNSLFYTDYFVVKLDEDADKLSLIEAAVSYCKTVEFLKKLFDEFDTPLPTVIRGDEINGLKEYNSGRNNKSLRADGRRDFEKGLKKYFKQEKTRNKHLRKWRAFMRTDKFDRKASRFKMFLDFSKRNEQLTSVELLNETNNDLKTTLINEHEYVKFREEIKKLYPDVLYSVSDIEVENAGFDVSHDKNKPIEEIRNGPFGKMVTYQAFCEEREKRFAEESYEALKNLNPVYYETRQLTYKEIDEPYIASVLNSIRFAYAKCDSLNTVRVPGIDIVSCIDVPVDDMMNFVSLAKANKVPFYLDCYGKFGKINFEKIRVVYSAGNDNIMNDIVARMIDEKVELSHIPTSLNTPPLDNKIKEARHVQLSGSDKIEFKNEIKKMEL